ncbi:MAG: YHS domain-containing (seleno)protein [Pseudomonadota bacterium]
MTRAKNLSMLLGALVFLIAGLATAGPDTETDRDGVILSGYDAVAYFTEGKPVKGSDEYTATYNEAIYRFSSAQNRDAFKADPSRYAPQYGGFCAYGLTFGKKFPVDGKAFEIVDGKLYVNKNRRVYKTWAKDVPGHIAEANVFWPQIENIPADRL